MRKKIFQLGLSRTGTYSLHKALRILGFSSRHYPDKPLKDVKHFDALSDIPVLAHLDEFIEKYPFDKYIITVREKESWLVSVMNHFSKRQVSKNKIINKYRLKIYGSTMPSGGDLVRAYDFHYDNILKKVEEYNLDCIIMDICNGDSWDKLCPFLNKSVLTMPFPKRDINKKKNSYG